MTKAKRIILGASLFATSFMGAIVLSAGSPTVARAAMLCPNVGCHTGFCDYEEHRTATCKSAGPGYPFECYDMLCY